MRLALLAKALLVGLLILGLSAPAPVAAADPDYALPGRLALPWACGQGHRITWTPADHWAKGKTVGVAFDFSMLEGTPLYAPVGGMAYFLRDERPSESNLGNYVELVADGDWLIRLAHLRDEQSGERRVKAGELLGYSGSSGASAAHLHLELLVREGKTWARPDLARLERLFGLATGDLVEGTILVNDGCPARLVLAGAVQPVQDHLPLGEAVELNVTLRNDGLEPITLNAIQVSLHDPTGKALMTEVQGTWLVEGKAPQSVVVRVQPNLPGTWQVRRVICQAGEVSYAFAAEGSFTADPSALKLVGVSSRPAFDVGERIVLEVWVENSGDSDLMVDDLRIEGLQPDGAPWTASAGGAVVIPRRSLSQFLLQSSTVLTNVGYWKITRVGYEREKQILYFAQVDESFALWGPELRVDRVAIYASQKSLDVFLMVTNIGTRDATLDALEVWGWKPDDEQQFSMKNAILRQLAPGRSALIRLARPLEPEEGLWRLVEAGYWTHGDYYRLALPEQPTVAVALPAPAEARSSP